MSEGRSGCQRKPSEEGYVLIAVIFILFILILTLTLAAPKVAKEIQRDRELETMQRGKQYIRAIRMYHKKFNAYPPTIDALVKTNEIRFLRKKYVDPTTGKDEWKAIHFGQNKTPTAMGFFGQPLTGSTLAGMGPSGGNGVAGVSNAGSAFMGAGATDAAGVSGTNSTSVVSDTGTTGSSDTGAAGGTSSTFSTGGQTFGGLGIIGFSPNSPKASILTYKKKNHYNEWEFVYDPIMEQRMMTGVSGAGPASGFSPAPTQQPAPPPSPSQ